MPSTPESPGSPRRGYKNEHQRQTRLEAGVEPRQPAPCGTPAAYRRHLRNNEKPDAACKKAWALNNRLARAKAKKAKRKDS